MRNVFAGNSQCKESENYQVFPRLLARQTTHSSDIKINLNCLGYVSLG